MKAETLLYTALIAYIYYEAPEHEQNFTTLIEFINASEVREDDEDFKNIVDLMFMFYLFSRIRIPYCFLNFDEGE